MNVLDLTRKYYEPRKASSAKGGEYHSGCPGCGDGGRPKQSDRFCVWPEENEGQGSYWCRRCGKGGDGIQFLRDFEGMSFQEACDYLGVEGKAGPATPYVGPRPKRRREQTMTSTWQPDPEQGPPPEVWREKAEALVEWAHMTLMRMGSEDGPKKMLMDRGLDESQMHAARLGWNPGKDGKDLFRPRESWGLAEELKEDGKKKKLWIPRGVVIPLLRDGEIWRIRIRTASGKPKYFVLPGSNMDCYFRGQGMQHRAYIIVETELDAVLLEGKAEDLAQPVALGNSSRKPDARLHQRLKGAAVILNALDYDKAGADQHGWWQGQYRQGKRWPVPKGKDPGEAYEQGVDLRGWVKAGLPKGWFV